MFCIQISRVGKEERQWPILWRFQKSHRLFYGVPGIQKSQRQGGYKTGNPQWDPDAPKTLPLICTIDRSGLQDFSRNRVKAALHDKYRKCRKDAQYWKSNFELVKELLLQATVYVYEDKQEIQGFIGLSNEYIEGIFVSAEMQSQGIGKILLNYVKGKRNKLILNVYQKNTRAISFYQREGFEIQYSGLDEATGEKDYVMAWQQK